MYRELDRGTMYFRQALNQTDMKGRVIRFMEFHGKAGKIQSVFCIEMNIVKGFFDVL